jgi:FtsP/CotA-like multicopper oxidase with cupredoxin domain
VVDLDPDPNVLEFDLEAAVSEVEFSPGVRTAVYTYNGSLPGPLIRARRGERVIAHFTNSLSESTSIHWHGMRVPNGMDGVPVTGESEVLPGGQFDYDFVVPDAGTFWYHPHFQAAEQTGDGLYAPYIVEDPDEPEGLGEEHVLVLSDVSVGPDGVLLPPDAGGDSATLVGREGNLVLVNGRVAPVTLRARAGARQRFRVINAARSRYFELELPGHELTRIGGDGGLLEAPEVVSSVLVAPAERADIVVEPGAGSSSVPADVTLRSLPYARGPGASGSESDLVRIQFTSEEPVVAPPLPPLHRDIPALDTSQATAVDLALTMDVADDGSVTMGMNGVPFWDAPPLHASIGERQVWTLRNTASWAHPFHLHGFFFQVLDVNGVPPAVREWKDTVNLPVEGVLRFVVDFDDRPGMWMFHCHILDHAEAGMMGMLELQ